VTLLAVEVGETDVGNLAFSEFKTFSPMIHRLAPVSKMACEEPFATLKRTCASACPKWTSPVMAVLIKTSGVLAVANDR